MFSEFSNGILFITPSFSEVGVSGITDTEEERIKESAAYVARRNLFATGEGVSVSKVAKSSSEEEHHEKKSRKVAIRESAERVALKKTVKEQRWTQSCKLHGSSLFVVQVLHTSEP